MHMRNAHSNQSAQSNGSVNFVYAISESVPSSQIGLNGYLGCPR